VGGLGGRLQNTPRVQRELSVGVRTDEGRRQSAEQIARWRQAGQIADDAHFFNTTPDAAHYLAYYSPGVRTFLDHRITPFRADVARDYHTARQALQELPSPEDEKKQRREPPAWRAVFANQPRRVDYVLFHSSDVFTTGEALTLRRLYANPKEFTVAHVSGVTAVFTWRDLDAGAAPAVPGGGIDFAALAFDSGDLAPLEPTAPSPRVWYSELLPQGLPPVRE